ncbi:hypothetical protein HK096_011222, partial [Nowakowskiella sp. JEL0078]
MLIKIILKNILSKEEVTLALKKQITNSQKEYIKLLDQEKDHEKVVSILKKELEEAKKNATDTEIILKQAKQQHD